ncbi:hypothetical protein [Rathayibacter oskolensis]|uniref:hypothetical protein n=1 Tax=Rathayibacter oskolensis TaxID=1891671 RepID=UPI0034679D92
MGGRPGRALRRQSDRVRLPPARLRRRRRAARRPRLRRRPRRHRRRCASVGGRSVVVIGTQKGHTVKELVAHNFGMAHPEGYRARPCG